MPLELPPPIPIPDVPLFAREATLNSNNDLSPNAVEAAALLLLEEVTDADAGLSLPPTPYPPPPAPLRRRLSDE